MSALLDLLRKTSALSGGNAAFIEDIYERYLHDPASIDPAWRKQFERMLQASANEAPDIAHGPVINNFARLARENRPASRQSAERLAPAAAAKQGAVLRLINAWRVRGHQHATLDPLNMRQLEDVPDLDPEFHRLSGADMDAVFNTGSLFAPDRMPLREIIALVKEVYGGNIGSEYMHITDTREKRWIQKRVEGHRIKPNLSTDEKRWLLSLLTAAEGLEKYLHTRYVGQKRFSLEGGDAFIPLMDELIQRAGANGMKDVVIGMAHRGRLNLLTNIMGKPPSELFDEFEGRKTPERFRSSGDVKYHMGFSVDIETPGGFTHVVLGFNPSHLEIISPVVQGSVRARQDRRGDHTRDHVMPILIHGDSAFSGQGVVLETLQMSQARGYTTGGCVHVVINNQVGFTTSNPQDTRSTLYCTDVGKMVQTPIFHVNGDDPEAVIFVTRVALDYRMRFHKDVIIDLVCYRRHGHNEADEPAVTQPQMYQKIRRLPTTRSLYADKLISEGVVTPDQARDMVEDYRTSLEQGSVVARPTLADLGYPYHTNFKTFENIHWEHPAETKVSEARLLRTAQKLVKMGFRGSQTGELVFDDCAVPVENRVGEENGGVAVVMSGLDLERAVISPLCVGMAERALELSIEYAKTREQFGRPIASFQMVQSKLADMYVWVETMKALNFKTLAEVNHLEVGGGGRGMIHANTAASVMYCANMLNRVLDEGVQVHGGLGYIWESEINRLFRGTKLLEIGAGTTEVRKMIISQELLK